MRTALALLVCLSGASAHAQQSGADGLYDFVPVAGGALRLNTRTGEVTLCADENGAVTCRPVASPRPAAGQTPPETNDRIAALEARIAALEAQTAANGPTLNDDEAVARVADLAEKVIRNFFGMVREFKREMDEGQL